MTVSAAPQNPPIICPAWCVRWDHQADVVDEQNPPRHYGPDFGVLSIKASGDEKPTALISTRISDVSAPDLRQLTADARSAADWLEAQA